MKEAKAKADILVAAIKYIKQFEQKIVVVKYGGYAMESEALKEAVFEDIALLWQLGLKIVVVHGGGPKIDSETKKYGLEKKMIHGLRVTDAATLEVVNRVLQQMNQDCVAHLKNHNVEAQDFTKGILLTKIGDKELGYVGDIIKVQTDRLIDAINQGVIPVISCIGRDESGQLTNINADTVATEIAIALKAEKLTILTNVDAILDAKQQRISHIDAFQAEEYIQDGTINGGMTPKVQACVKAVKHGVKKAHLLNGTMARALLLEIFTDKGIGTEVVKS